MTPLTPLDVASDPVAGRCGPIPPWADSRCPGPRAPCGSFQRGRLGACCPSSTQVRHTFFRGAKTDPTAGSCPWPWALPQAARPLAPSRTGPAGSPPDGLRTLLVPRPAWQQTDLPFPRGPKRPGPIRPARYPASRVSWPTTRLHPTRSRLSRPWSGKPDRLGSLIRPDLGHGRL